MSKYDIECRLTGNNLKKASISEARRLPSFKDWGETELEQAFNEVYFEIFECFDGEPVSPKYVASQMERLIGSR